MTKIVFCLRNIISTNI